MPVWLGPIDLIEMALWARTVTVFNRTTTDQNFLILAGPGSVQMTPTGQLGVLAWMNVLVPGESGGITSQGSFFWNENLSLLLGSIDQRVGASFVPGTSVPLTLVTDNAASVGFIGQPANGAPKLIGVSTSTQTGLFMSSDGSVPGAAEQAAVGRIYSLAWGVGADGDVSGAAVALQLLPNMTSTLLPPPSYRIFTTAMTTTMGDLLPTPADGSGFVLEFGSTTKISLAFEDDNLFHRI